MGLTFKRASELADAPPTEWLLYPYIPAGCLIEISGKAKAAGKSTLLQHMVRAILDGSPFLGEPTVKGEVLYLSEEGSATLKPALSRVGLLRDELHILQWYETWGHSWKAIIAATKIAAKETGARVVIVDTFPQFAPGSEVDSDSGLEALAPLRRLTQAGLAVIIVRHDRKTGGGVGQSARGTTAIGAGVDIMCHLRRKGVKGRTNARVLDALSRFPEIPESVAIELTDEGFVKIEKASAELVESKRKILSIMNGVPASIDSLIEGSKLTRSTVNRALISLLQLGAISQVGKGTKGDPKLYKKTLSLEDKKITLTPPERV